MKPLGLVVLDKKIVEKCILRTYLLTQWPTDATNKQEGLQGPRSLTWEKGQGSQWSYLQRTTNIVHQILVEDL